MIKPKEIDLREADGYFKTDADLVVDRLRLDGLYNPRLMYRGFNGKRLNIMLKHGTDIPSSDMIFCCDEEKLRSTGMEETECALDYAIKQPIPALAVYDGSRLKVSQVDNRMEFIEPSKKLDALVAVFLLKK